MVVVALGVSVGGGRADDALTAEAIDAKLTLWERLSLGLGLVGHCLSPSSKSLPLYISSTFLTACGCEGTDTGLSESWLLVACGP